MPDVSRKKKIVIITGFIILALAAVVCVSAWQSRYCVRCSYYTVSADKLTGSVRVVLLADLHNSKFGEENSELTELVAQQKPDIICFAGDLVNYYDEDASTAVELIKKLSEIAPVYISMGNHERVYQSRFGIDTAELYTEAGGIVADKEFFELEINGQKIRLGGIYGYCMPEKHLRTGEAKRDEVDFLHDFMDTDAYTLLMCHMPYTWLVQNGLQEWQIDCVLSGHTHGGQVVIPGIGGVYAPDQGYFPRRLQGVYLSKDSERALVLTRGLGNSVKLPRINNIPEILVLDLIPGE